MPCIKTVPSAAGFRPEDSLHIIMTHPLVVKQHSDAVIYVHCSTLTAAAFHSVSRPANIVFSMKNTSFTAFSARCQNQKLRRFSLGASVENRVYMKGQGNSRWLTKWGDFLENLIYIFFCLLVPTWRCCTDKINVGLRMGHTFCLEHLCVVQAARRSNCHHRSSLRNQGNWRKSRCCVCFCGGLSGRRTDVQRGRSPRWFINSQIKMRK